MHEGHEYSNVYDDEGDRDDYPECSCGVPWECRRAAFCSSHGQDSVEIELNAEELSKFIDTFKPIYEVLFYIKAKP